MLLMMMMMMMMMLNVVCVLIDLLVVLVDLARVESKISFVYHLAGANVLQKIRQDANHEHDGHGGCIAQIVSHDVHWSTITTSSSRTIVVQLLANQWCRRRREVVVVCVMVVAVGIVRGERIHHGEMSGVIFD
jgi:hypothetical protein